MMNFLRKLSAMKDDQRVASASTQIDRAPTSHRRHYPSHILPPVSSGTSEVSASASDSPAPHSASPSLENLPVPLRSRSQNDSDISQNIVNLDHAELLLHLMVDTSLFSLAIGNSNFPRRVSVGVELGLEAPYLLHQLLAYSARHLAYLRPAKARKYQQLAFELQTRAVTVYNEREKEITQENCVPVMIFAAVLGHHVFADTMAERGPGGLAGFAERFTRCLDIQRGVATIFKATRPFLMNSVLKDVMAISLDLTDREPTGNDCDDARGLINRSHRLDDEGKEACLHALRFIQIGLDVYHQRERGSTELLHHHEMCFTWTIMLHPKLSALLSSQHPDALGVLAYYSLLLHLGRDCWQVRDVGVYLMSLLADYMGTTERAWLEYPRKKMSLG